MANINNTRGYDGCPANLISWNVKSLNHPVKFKKMFSHLNSSVQMLHSYKRPIYVPVIVLAWLGDGLARCISPISARRLGVLLS